MNIIEILKAIVLGVIEGISEWLPISSTGHMILADEFIKLNVSKEFMSMFLVVIQLGAILAVVLLFFNKLNPFSLKKLPRQRKETLILWSKVLIAVLPAGVLGVLFDDKIEEMFFNYKTVTITLILYGILFIIIEKMNKHRRPSITSFDKLSYKTALIIGLFQILALIPGTSRSGATILGAILLGTSRFVAAEFSFFLAIPVMFGASALKILKFGFSFTSSELVILFVGMFTAFLVSIIAIKFLMTYIKKNDFSFFGYYRIVLGICILLYFTFV